MDRPVLQTFDSSETVITVSSVSTLPVDQVTVPGAVFLKGLDSPISKEAEKLSPATTRCPTPSSTHDSSSDQGFPKLFIRLCSSYFILFVSGWGDGVFKAEYQLSDMTASLYFVATTVGFLLGTMSIEHVLSFLGRPGLRTLFRRQKCVSANSASWARLVALTIAATLHGLYFLLMAFRLGFISSLAAYVLSAYARAFLSALIYTYVSTTPSKPMAYALASWSLGAVVAPLISQTVLAKGIPWINFYYGSIVLAGLNTAFIIYAFLPSHAEIQKELSAFSGNALKPGVPGLSTLDKDSHETLVVAPKTALRTAVRTPYQWAFSAMFWLYSGSETSLQGYIATYLLAARNASPSTVGYVASGFWAGQTVSRIIWNHYSMGLAFLYAEEVLRSGIHSGLPLQSVVSSCASPVIAVVAHVIIVFVPSMVAGAVATALAGLAWGPFFPECIKMEMEILDPEIHMISISILNSASTMGSAIFPFITGTLSSQKGPHVIGYFLLAQATCVLFTFAVFPSKKPVKQLCSV
ncbi:major facilitator superfamily domain-containing protein [Pterulicium gracile]|uniref:Major facilitator superfamily domain-containing protein n=1 Tax=Pterulicium gracile TaxID=1884261 RepID=A0A5C3QYN6_9AGAR|nr:major facilitator superfamily domain-containing protein [Pterula gracilis]